MLTRRNDGVAALCYAAVEGRMGDLRYFLGPDGEKVSLQANMSGSAQTYSRQG